MLIQRAGIIGNPRLLIGSRHTFLRPFAPTRSFVSQYPSTISCDGTAIGLPLAGDRYYLIDIINTRASTCASTDSGTCTAIWSPSKSALNAAQTSGCSRMAFPFDPNGIEGLNSEPV